MTADVDVTVDLGKLGTFTFLDELEQPGLDLERVRELLGDLEIALEDPRLVRRFERLVRGTRGASGRKS